MEYIEFIVTIIIILVIFYIAGIPDRQQKKELKKMQDELKVGDKIITYSGMSGVIKDVSKDKVVVEVYPKMTEITFEKWSIAGFDEVKIEK